MLSRTAIARWRPAVRELGIAALVTASVVSATACDKPTAPQSPPSSPQQPTAATAKRAPQNIAELCSGLTWPRPVPAFVGVIVNTTAADEVKPLTCLGGLRGVDPDGGVVYSQEAFARDAMDRYRIAAVSPPPGTPVGPRDPVTVTLAAVEKNAPIAYQPCDWVTDAEAGRFLGGIPIVAGMDGYEMGSNDIECGYASHDKTHQVTSALRLTDAQVVDTASEFAFQTAENTTAVSGLGMQAACTLTPNFHQLFVLLPGDRIYVATGWGHETCDTLTQFARAAIPRIGT